MFNQPKKHYKTIIIILSIFSISLIFLFIFSKPKTHLTKIDNFSQFNKTMPKSKQAQIFAALYQNIALNLTESSTPPPKNGAFIRNDTYNDNYDRTKEFHYGSFIVDLPNLKQSYLIQYEWSNDPKNPSMSDTQTLITCPEKTSVIYPDFHCVDQFTNSALNPYDIIIRYLPYVETDQSILKVNGSNTVYSVEFNTYLNQEPYLMVKMNSCGNPQNIQIIKDSFTSWLKSHHVKIDDLSIEYRDFCPGEI